MNYKVVIFDLDNTLINFDKMEEGSLKETLVSLNVKLSEKMILDYKVINKKLWDGLEQKLYEKKDILVLRFKRLFDKYDIKASPELANDMYLSNMSNHLQMFEGAYDILDALKGKTKLVCLTNGVLKAQKSKLDKGNLRMYFDEIIISDEVGCHKPDVKIFDYMISKIGEYDKSEMIIIGDSLTSDIQGGINFGISTVWFNYKNISFNGPKIFDYEINELKALNKILL